MEIPTHRVCFACKQDKPIEEFYRSNVRYYQRECKVCNKIRRSLWWKSPKGRLSAANTKLKSRFGITLIEYEELVGKCGNKCEICGASSSVNGHRLAVDHDHKTGAIRGILCKACNSGIASFSDDPNKLKSAIVYLEKQNLVINQNGGK